MKKLRRAASGLRGLLFRMQVIRYGLHAYRYTRLVLYPDEPFFTRLSQFETTVRGARARRAPHQSRRTRKSKVTQTQRV